MSIISVLRKLIKRDKRVDQSSATVLSPSPPSNLSVTSDSSGELPQSDGGADKVHNDCPSAVSSLAVTEDSSQHLPPSDITVDKVRDSLELTEDFQRGLALIESGQHVLLTGAAGSGKTTLLNYFRTHTKKQVVVVAPTGIAALNAQGVTIHSFFRFRPGPIDLDAIRRIPDRQLLERLDALVIDEVSMVRADLLDAIDRFLRLNRREALPFGGIQLILVGDPFQLPPVVATRPEALLFGTRWSSPYFFSAHALALCEITPVVLTKPFRQNDPEFLTLLNAIRCGQISEAYLACLNERVEHFKGPRPDYITLTTTNALADRHNTAALHALPLPEVSYEGQISGTFDFANDRLPSPRLLRLRRGAQVMFTKNDSEKRWVNGSLGLVRDLSDSLIQVELIDHLAHPTFDVTRTTWETLRYRYDPTTQRVVSEVIGVYSQYPLTLGWATTIHKSQGKTLTQVRIDLGSGAFAHGQLYVALSRCRTLEGLLLSRSVRASDVICDPRVVGYYATLSG